MKLFRAIILVIIFVVAFWLIPPKLPVYYKSPGVSGILVDANTDKPIEGATVQVSWSSLRPKFIHGSDLKELHVASATTNARGEFTIPGWGPVSAAKEWIYYVFDPTISFSKPGYKSDRLGNHNHQDSVTSSAMPFGTVTLDRPSWHGQRIAIHLSDGKGDWDPVMQKDRSLIHNPYLGY